METKQSRADHINMKQYPKQGSDSDGPKRAQQNELAVIVQLIIKNGLFLQRELNQSCQQSNLTLNQFNVINEIILHGPISQKVLCERLLFEKSNVSKIIKTLQDRDLVNVSVAPGDRRLTLLIETPQGTEIWRKCLQHLDDSSHDLISSLTENEINKTLKQLKKIEKVLIYKMANKKAG